MNRFFTYVRTPFKYANPTRTLSIANEKHIVNLAGAISMKVIMKNDRSMKNAAEPNAIAAYM